MSAEQEIAGLLKQWLALTQAEGAAIQNSSWRALRQTQEAKASLKNLLDEAKEKWNEEQPDTATARGANPPLFTLSCRLRSLETRNSEMLAAKLRQARGHQESLNEAARNLHKVCKIWYVLKREGILNRYS